MRTQERSSKKPTIGRNTPFFNQGGAQFFLGQTNAAIGPAIQPQFFTTPPTQNVVQRDGEESETPAPESQEQQESPTPTSRNYLGELVGGIVESNLGNSGFRGHLNSLGEELQSLATSATEESLGDPTRLAAIGIERAFTQSAGDILQDPALTAIRETLIESISDHDELALVTALAGAIAAYFLDMNLQHSQEFNLGPGSTLGGEVDLGSAQDVQFRRMNLFLQFAGEYFSARIGGEVEREVSEAEEETEPEEQISGSAMGQLRIGSDISHIFGRVTADTEGNLVFNGRLQLGQEFGRNSRLIFSTDVNHETESGETIVRPGLSGRINLGNNQSIRLGSSLAVSSDAGLTGLQGHVEYRSGEMRLRLEGNIEGIASERSIAPASGTSVQLEFSVPF